MAGQTVLEDIVMTGFADPGLLDADSVADAESLLAAQWQDVFGGSIVDVEVDGSAHGSGRGVVRGGRGFDFASFGDSDRGVVTSIDRSAPKLLLPYVEQSGVVAAKYVSTEGLIGTDHDDVLVGDRQGNVIFGGAGDDVLIGEMGRRGRADVLIGGSGDDLLLGGGGGDLLVGGSGDDLLIAGAAPTAWSAATARTASC